MGLLISTTTSRGEFRERVDTAGVDSNLNAVEKQLDISDSTFASNLEASNSIRNFQNEVLHIINIGEAVGTQDFDSRCQNDKYLINLAVNNFESANQELEIEEFISTLPQELSDLVEFLYEDMSTREIARKLGVAKGTIQYRIEKLRRLTQAYFAEAQAA